MAAIELQEHHRTSAQAVSSQWQALFSDVVKARWTQRIPSHSGSEQHESIRAISKSSSKKERIQKIHKIKRRTCSSKLGNLSSQTIKSLQGLLNTSAMYWTTSKPLKEVTKPILSTVHLQEHSRGLIKQVSPTQLQGPYKTWEKTIKLALPWS